MGYSRKCLFFLLIILFVPQAAFGDRKQGSETAVRAALLADVASGRILYERNANMPIQPASLSKILALYLVNEELRKGIIHLTDSVRISAAAARTGGAKMFYREGEVVALTDLIKAMAVSSANDAAVAVAEHTAGSVPEFVARMNTQACRLGMSRSYFVNPHGLSDSRQFSTATDLFTLSRSYLQQFPDMLQIHSLLYLRHGSEKHFNRNMLLADYPGVDGLKTGYVRVAGYHLIATAKRGDVRLVAVILGAGNPRDCASWAKKLLNEGFREFGLKDKIQ